MVNIEATVTDLLVGSDRTLTFRMLYGAVALCPITVIYLLLASVVTDASREIVPLLLVAAVALTSALNGYLGGGLVASVALGISPPIGFGILGLINEWLYDPQGDSPLWALVVVFIVSVGAIAIVAFSVGTAARWAVG